MLNADMLLDAMQGIRPENVRKGEVFLGYTEEVRHVRHVRRKLWSTLLVAAILISLLTITAYALGLFQMSGHRGKESFTAQYGGQNISWTGEYVFEFEGPEECPEVHFKTTWAPDNDYWFPADWAADWTQLVEGREIYNEEYGIYTASCVVDVMYAPQFVDGGAMVLIGFQPQEITQETWGEVQVYKFQAKATHAIGIEQNQQYCVWAEKRLEMADDDKTIQGYADGVFWERNTSDRQQKERRDRSARLKEKLFE